MIKRTLTAAAVLAMVSGPAFAAHCPTDVKAIDVALGKNPPLSSGQLAEVKKLRDQGDKLHGSGRHGDSISNLHKAMKILGIRH